MDRNIIKELHNDLEKLIIKEYLNVYENLSLGDIAINHDKTIISFHILDENGEYIETEKIEFSNKNWKTEDYNGNKV